MIELGDKARIFYKEKGYSEDIAGENKIQPLVIEEAIFSKKFRYAGKPDIICRVNGKVAVIDIKTGDYIATAHWQTAAYLKMYNEYADIPGIEATERYLLLMPEGGAACLRKVESNVEKDFADFLSMLRVYNLKKGL
jgi:hypothetical protein